MNEVSSKCAIAKIIFRQLKNGILGDCPVVFGKKKKMHKISYYFGKMQILWKKRSTKVIHIRGGEKEGELGVIH